MQTYQDYSNTPKTYGPCRQLRKGEFYRSPEMRVEAPLQNCCYVMNRRNVFLGYEPQPVDLRGFEVDPMIPHKTMDHRTAMWAFLNDGGSSYDGVSLVLPNTPIPVTKIDGKDYFLVAGIYENSTKHIKTLNYQDQELYHHIELSKIFLADMISLGNPFYGISPTEKRNYFFGLSECPIKPFKNKNISIFSYGGVIAIGSSYHPNYDETGIESEIKILTPEALKTIEIWRKEAANNDI